MIKKFYPYRIMMEDFRNGYCLGNYRTYEEATVEFELKKSLIDTAIRLLEIDENSGEVIKTLDRYSVGDWDDRLSAFWEEARKEEELREWFSGTFDYYDDEMIG